MAAACTLGKHHNQDQLTYEQQIWDDFCLSSPPAIGRSLFQYCSNCSNGNNESYRFDIMRMRWKWVGFDLCKYINDEDKNEKDNYDEDDGGNLAGVLPIVLWSDPLDPQVVPVLVETLVPANLFGEQWWIGEDVDMAVSLLLMMMLCSCMLKRWSWRTFFGERWGSSWWR